MKLGRAFVLLLMLIIVFLTGMLFGVKKTQTISTQTTKNSSAEIEQSSPETNQEDNRQEKQTKPKQEKQSDSNTDQKDDDQYFTHKTASFLEKGVKGFYNIVVEVMYGLSKVFF